MSTIDQSHIRNFCIIAHIDHGKSTLADRIIEQTGLLTSREMQSQVLDNMDLERERGITIKAQAVRTVYQADDGEEYIFNLIDTPGHVDFNYEVSRSLAACDGAILVVDAAQGVEAQTLANVYLALDHDLDVMPVINKIDLPSAEPERVKEEIEDVIGIDAENAPLISAKTGLNVHEVLEQIVQQIPSPVGDPDAPLQALIFDSKYDSYKGVIVFCRIKEGTVKKGTPMLMMATGAKAEVVEVGTFGAGQFIPCDALEAGMVGYITASLKNVKDTRVGDTITNAENPCAEPLPGYKKVNPMVYCGLYPADGAKYPDLRDALEKLQLNDAALQFEAETSVALGFGFRCGFLGLLHLEIIQERLERDIQEKYQKYVDNYETIGRVALEAQLRADKMIEETQEKCDKMVADAEAEAKQKIVDAEQEIDGKLLDGKKKYLALQEEMSQIVDLINSAQKHFADSYNEVHKIIDAMPTSFAEMEGVESELLPEAEKEETEVETGAEIETETELETEADTEEAETEETQNIEPLDEEDEDLDALDDLDENLDDLELTPLEEEEEEEDENSEALDEDEKIALQISKLLNQEDQYMMENEEE